MMPPRCCKPPTACSTKCLTLGRMKDLSTQAANGTYSDDDLQAMQDEYDELGQQMSDMLQKTPLTAAPTCSVFPAPATPVLTVCSRAR